MRVYPFTEEKRARWEAEGRGTGTGAEYLSWLRYEDLNSTGNKHRAMEGRHGRMCALFSDIEFRAFLGLDASPIVMELYDQFPIPLEKTLEIADELGIQHPRDPKTGVEITMTTDLVGIMRADSHLEIPLPIMCKWSEDLKEHNTSEHLEVERLYWLRHHGAKAKIFTEREQSMSKVHFDNLCLLFPHRMIHRTNSITESSALTFDERTNIVIKQLLALKGSASLIEFATYLQMHFGLALFDWTSQIYHLIYKRVLRANVLQGDLRQANMLDIAASSGIQGGFHLRSAA